MALVVRQFAWAAELNTSLHRSLTALAGACADEFALELSKPSEHGEHQSAVRCRRIGPRVLERLETRPGLSNLVQDVEQIARRSSEPIKASDNKDISPPRNRHRTNSGAGRSPSTNPPLLPETWG